MMETYIRSNSRGQTPKHSSRHAKLIIIILLKFAFLHFIFSFCLPMHCGQCVARIASSLVWEKKTNWIARGIWFFSRLWLLFCLWPQRSLQNVSFKLWKGKLFQRCCCCCCCFYLLLNNAMAKLELFFLYSVLFFGRFRLRLTCAAREYFSLPFHADRPRSISVQRYWFFGWCFLFRRNKI